MVDSAEASAVLTDGQTVGPTPVADTQSAQDASGLTLDEKLMIALREARRHHLAAWLTHLQEHRGHAGFRVQQWPFSLEFGFTCDCIGVDQEWRIRVHALREMLPEARESLMRMYRNRMAAGGKLRKRQAAKAHGRARALLHRHLTKEQRYDLRASRSFKVVGKDGRTYTITEGSCNNVTTVDNGVTYSLCVIPRDGWLPVYDWMLAQKVLLEADAELFHRTAIVHNRSTDEVYQNGGFLSGQGEKVVVRMRQGEVRRDEVRRVNEPDHVIDEPREWVEQQLAGGGS